MIKLAYIAPEMAEDFEEAVRLGAETGVRSLALRPRIWGKNLEELSAGELRRMREVLDRYGSAVSAIYSGAGKCNIEDEAEVRRSLSALERDIELAHAFGTNLVRVFPFQRARATEYEPSRLGEYLPKIVERWMPLVEVAQREEMVLCFEGVGSTLARTAQELRQVVEALGSPPAAGIVWEIDVAWRAGELPSQGYRFAQGVVRDIHVKPNPELPLAGVGETYEQVFRSLLADGYDGPATVEHWGTAEAAMEALRRLSDVLQRLH